MALAIKKPFMKDILLQVKNAMEKIKNGQNLGRYKCKKIGFY
jgi:hypothetical protein